MGDPTALELLKETIEHLKAQKHIDNNRAKTPNLDNTLKEIQLSLARIERKDSTTPGHKNYAAAAAVAQSNSKTPEQRTVPLLQKDPRPKQAKTPMPKEKRWAKEITVHISNKADKEKIKMLSTKNLVEVLQAKTKSIQGVSRLFSKNIKIHTKSLKAKKVLQKQTE